MTTPDPHRAVLAAVDLHLQIRNRDGRSIGGSGAGHEVHAVVLKKLGGLAAGPEQTAVRVSAGLNAVALLGGPTEHVVAQREDRRQAMRLAVLHDLGPAGVLATPGGRRPSSRTVRDGMGPI